MEGSAALVLEQCPLAAQALAPLPPMVLSCVDGPFCARVLLSDIDHCGLRSCVRPVGAVLVTAGPDDVRLPGPYQTIELLRPDKTSGFPGCGPV